MVPYIEIDGRPATADDIRLPATVHYGHFTAMQVRDGRVRGLALHLARLDAGNRELFRAGLDGDLVRDRIRHALGTVADASVRVSVLWAGADDATAVMVTVRPPGEPPAAPQRLLTVPYQRSVAHVKHVGDFGQVYYGRLAGRRGYDDALLTGPDGTISETTIANVGFFDGTAVVWPDAPVLDGITMQLLGGPRRPVRVADLRSFDGMFVTNSRGIAAVESVDGVALPVATGRVKALVDAYASVPAELI